MFAFLTTSNYDDLTFYAENFGSHNVVDIDNSIISVNGDDEMAYSFIPSNSNGMNVSAIDALALNIYDFEPDGNRNEYIYIWIDTKTGQVIKDDDNSFVCTVTLWTNEQDYLVTVESNPFGLVARRFEPPY